MGNTICPGHSKVRTQNVNKPNKCTCGLELFSENRVTSEQEYWSSKMVDEVGGPCRNLRYLL